MALDVFAIRLINYKSLLLQFRARPDQTGLPEHGFLTRFADHVSLSARYLSHINNGRKNIGETYARALEVGFMLPHGWLDNLHDSDVSSASDSEKEFAATALRMFRENPVEAQAMLMRLVMSRIDAKKK